MEAGYAVGSIIRLMRGWKLLIKLESLDASSGFDATGFYQAWSFEKWHKMHRAMQMTCKALHVEGL